MDSGTVGVHEILATWLWRLLPTVGDNSLLLLAGDRHQRHRQLLMPLFHGERMKAYGELICRLTEGPRCDRLSFPFAGA